MEGVKMELDITAQLGEIRAKVLEEHLRLHVQPKPRWLPQFIWKALLKRLLYLEVFTQ